MKNIKILPYIRIPIQLEEKSAFERVLEIHAEHLEKNSYCYFELAYTRHTDWMVWICSNARSEDPNRKVILNGQGDTPEEACANALQNYNKDA